LLNKEVSINVINKKSKSSNKEYADIAWLSQRIKKIPLHERKAKTSFLHLSEKYYNPELFETLPWFVREKIEQSPEWQKLHGVENVAEANAEFESELAQAETGKTINQVESSVAQAKEVSTQEAQEVFGTTENMQ
jgi:hypothetical protein